MKSKVQIELKGRAKVTSPTLEDLTPSGSKITGLLALLCVADGKPCSREWLQSKLWSDRSSKQAQDSLRHALASLKSSLNPHSNILIVKNKNIAIDRSKTLIDLYDDLSINNYGEDKQFLAGLSIRDKEFVNWRDQTDTAFASSSTTKTFSDTINSDFCISIGIPPIVEYGEASLIVGQALISGVTAGLRNIGAFSVYDYTAEPEPTDSNFVPDVLLALHISLSNGAYLLSLSVTCISDKKILFSTVRTIKSNSDTATEIANISFELTDRIAMVLANTTLFQSSEKHQASKCIWGAIENMFSLSSGNLDDAEQALTVALEIDPKGVFYAWYAYLMVFRYEELKDEYKKDLKDKALHLAETALAKDGCNPLTTGLVAHVHSFIFRDFNRAEQLLQPVIATAPETTVALDSYAMLKFYQGDFASARKFAIQVFNRSLFSPYRYCFATSLCMIDTAMGNFSSAISFEEQAISMHRSDRKKIYAPTLRYLSVAQAETGNLNRAISLYKILSSQEPSFHPDDILEAGYPMPNQGVARYLSKSLAQIERNSAA